MKKVFTTGDVARICRVTINTVVKWFDTGELKGYRIPSSKARRVPRRNLIAFMKKFNFPMDEIAAYKVRILVVDSDTRTRNLIKKAFSDSEKFLLKEATSGFEAGILTKNLLPDIIFLNVNMRDIDGARTCKFLRENGETAQTRVIALTKASSSRKVKELKKQGFADCFARPFTRKRLTKLVANYDL